MRINIGKDEDGCFCRNAGFLNYQNAEPEAEKQMQNIYSIRPGRGRFQMACQI